MGCTLRGAGVVIVRRVAGEEVLLEVDDALAVRERARLAGGSSLTLEGCGEALHDRVGVLEGDGEGTAGAHRRLALDGAREHVLGPQLAAELVTGLGGRRSQGDIVGGLGLDLHGVLANLEVLAEQIWATSIRNARSGVAEASSRERERERVTEAKGAA